MTAATAGGTAPVVAIDGPSGSGKGTVAFRLARELGYHLLDSGALYRLVALVAERRAVRLDDSDALAGVASGLDVEFRPGDEREPMQPWMGQENVGPLIRNEACGARASRVAAHRAVRSALLARQRGFRRPPGLVADGRDMGTVVFPDAAVKIFLDATLSERARRRHNQLIQQGINVSLPSLLEELTLRDRRDRERATAPLKPAEDAVVIDTSGHDVEAVFSRVLDLVIAGKRTRR